MLAIDFSHVNKKFLEKNVISDFSFQVEKGEFVSLIGASGSGKSTILNMVGLFEKQDSGEIRMYEQLLPNIESREATRLRRDTINYLFQSFALVNNITVAQNLMFAMKFKKGTELDKDKQMRKALDDLGINSLLNMKVSMLSGGEQQRVAIARTMLKNGDLILADEPTGSLDPETADVAFKLIKDLRDKYGKTILMVTHNIEEANKTDRVIEIVKQ